MNKKLLIASLILFVSAGAVGVWLWRPARLTNNSFSKSQTKVHHAEDASIDLSKIEIRAVYFVPADIESQTSQTWQKAITTALDELVAFHRSQFSDASNLSYKIFPSAFVGQKTVAQYAANDLPNEPKALELFSEEIKSRILDSAGDSYDVRFAEVEDDTYFVNIIFVEGDFPKFEGEAGTFHDILGYGDEKQTAVVYRKILTDDPHRDYGTAIAYHEIGHMLGLGDEYDYVSLTPTSDDIMGAGRFRPLKLNYFQHSSLQKLGLP